MRGRLQVAVVLLPFGLLVAAEQEDPGSSLPAGVIARVNGRDVSEREYQEWLYRLHGWKYQQDFLAAVALRQEVERLELTILPAEVERALAEDWQHQILFRHEGREEALLKELARSGIDKQGYLARRRVEIESNVLAEAILRHTRSPDEGQLRKLYHQEFGDAGERIHLRIAYFSKFYQLQPTRTPSSGMLEKLDLETRERATSFVQTLQAGGESFGELVRTHSDPLLVPRTDNWVRDLRVSGGEVERFTPDQFQGALKDALVQAVAPGTVLDPIVTSGGYYVVQMVARELAPFEAVRDELVEIYRQRPPTAREMHFLEQELLENANIVRRGG